VRIAVANSASDTRLQTLTLSTTIILWGAQLEQRSSVTAYTATTTAPITNYIPALQTAASGVARFEHNPVTGESLGLEIEEQRTNLVTYSDDFSNAAWTKTRSSITSNTIVAPDGTLTGDKLVEDTSATNSHTLRSTISLSAVAHTLTVYAKAAERSFIRLVNASVTNGGAYFNLSTGALGTVGANATASITSVGNGWYRCAITVTAISGSNSIDIRLADADGGDFYTGDGYKGAYLWGAQLEAGAFATSYIPTTSATVTRSADAASMTGTNFSSWYRADEGTVYSESNYVALPTVDKAVFNISDGTSSNSIQIYAGSNGGTRLYVATNGSQVVNLTSPASTITAGTFYKQAGAYAVNNSIFSYNGTNTSVDTACTIPVVDRITLGNLNGNVKKLAYYPKRLTNAEIQSLTTV
jgi:hypothetical protein